MRKILTAVMFVVVAAASLLLAGCKKGESVWDTTPVPTNAPITLVVPRP